MPEQQSVLVLPVTRHLRPEDVAEALLGNARDGNAIIAEHLGNGFANRVGAGLVEAVGVDVDEALQQRFHLAGTRRQPGQHLVGHVAVQHGGGRHLRRSVRMRPPSSPRS